MNGYHFCLIVNLSTCALVAWLAWLYATTSLRAPWLVLIMALVSIRFIIPSTDIFTCPKCGHIDRVKTYTAAYGTFKAHRADKAEAMETPKPSTPQE